MSEKAKESLSVFMKKQISKKSSEKTQPISTTKNTSQQSGDQKKEEEQDAKSKESEMSDEEKLAEAKKASSNKAAERNQVEMFKKLILESVIKYVAAISLLAILAIGVIKLGPVIGHFFNGLIFRMMMGSI